MMEEGLAVADLRELVHLPYQSDVLVVCTSVGWTNEKHMLYLSLLEESFVSQLHDSKYSFKELFNHSPGACIHELSSKGHVKNVEAEQEHMDVDEVDRAESWIKIEHVRSPSENQDDVKVCFSDDNASSTRLIQECYARATSSGQSSTCHLGKNRHSPSRSAEGSDQNFIDEEIKGSGEPNGRCSKKRLKSTANTMDDQSYRKQEKRMQISMTTQWKRMLKLTSHKDNAHPRSVLQA
uniref:Uncharacterized protein n=1 Tax=Oryza rufipogon TaxID=4529 RepID=A0A0E0QBB6_ORYRU